jgi:hypothetical protein
MGQALQGWSHRATWILRPYDVYRRMHGGRVRGVPSNPIYGTPLLEKEHESCGAPIRVPRPTRFIERVICTAHRVDVRLQGLPASAFSSYGLRSPISSVRTLNEQIQLVSEIAIDSSRVNRGKQLI